MEEPEGVPVTEHDREEMRLKNAVDPVKVTAAPGRLDRLDQDDSQTQQASSKPLI